MISRLTIVISALWSLMATAPTWSKAIEVRSGEHGDFTRLVLYLPEKQDWLLTSEGDIFTFTTQGWDEGYDVSEVYRMIDDNRVRSLASSGEKLIISLGCACDIVPVELANGFVSLDIRGTNVKRPSPRPPNEVLATPHEQIAPRVDTIPRLSEFTWPVVFPDDPSMKGQNQLPLGSRKMLAQNFKRSLGEEIAAGATQDFLEPNSTILHLPYVPPTEQTEKRRAELLEELAKRSEFTSADDSPVLKSAAPTTTCSTPGIFEISTWVEDVRFPVRLARLRSELFSEFDKLDKDVAKELIKLYIAYDLLPEARSFLDDFFENDELGELRALVNGLRGRIDPTNFMDSILHCEGETGFWGAIVAADNFSISEEKTEELVAVFQILPLRLKEAAAERLIRLFEQQGFLTASEVIKNSLSRYVEPETGEAQRIVLDFELSAMSAEQLFGIIEKNDETSPGALSAYLKKSLENGQEISPEIIELTSSYVRQLAGSDMSRELKSLNVKSLSEFGDADLALTKLFDEPADELFEIENLRTSVATSLLKKAKAKNIAIFVWKMDQISLLETLPDARRMDLAEFLQDHGQPDLSIRVLNGLMRTRSVQEIITRNDILLGQTQQALDGISSMQGAELSQSLSEFTISEDANFAWENQDRLNDVAVKEIAWVTKKWNQVESNDARGELAEILAQSEQSFDLTERPLENSQKIAETSENTRRLLDTLLGTDTR